MTITIDLPEDVERSLESLAKEFGSADAAITHLIRDAVVCKAGTAEGSRSEMRQHLDALRAMAKPRGTNVDYSRESSYPETVW